MWTNPQETGKVTVAVLQLDRNQLTTGKTRGSHNVKMSQKLDRLTKKHVAIYHQKLGMMTHNEESINHQI